MPNQDPPTGQEPAAQSQRYQEDVQQQKQRIQYKKPKIPEIKIEKEKAEPLKAGAIFLLREVKITGSTVFKEQDFRQIYQPYLNKKVTFQDMQAVSAKIESKYKEKGYFTTLVYIPEQEIKDGVIEIRIAEGKMGKLNIEGNKWFSAAFIEKFFHAKK